VPCEPGLSRWSWRCNSLRLGNRDSVQKNCKDRTNKHGAMACDDMMSKSGKQEMTTYATSAGPSAIGGTLVGRYSICLSPVILFRLGMINRQIFGSISHSISRRILTRDLASEVTNNTMLHKRRRSVTILSVNKY